MRRWLEPTAAGVMLFALFLAFQALCGDTTSTTEPSNIYESPNAPPLSTRHTITTFGAPTLFEWHETQPPGSPVTTGLAMRPLPLIAVVAAGWVAAMCLGRLMRDGGASAAERTLLPPRRNPALWLFAYVAAIPMLALPGLAIDLLHGGLRGLGSPDGPSTFPLFVLVLLFFGLPIVAIFLAVRRVLDRRAMPRPFEADAPVKTELPWPF